MRFEHNYTHTILDVCRVLIAEGAQQYVSFYNLTQEQVKFWESIRQTHDIYPVYDNRGIVVENKTTHEKKYFYPKPESLVIMELYTDSFTIVDGITGLTEVLPYGNNNVVNFYPPVIHVGQSPLPVVRPNEDHVPSDPDELEVEPDERPNLLEPTPSMLPLDKPLTDVCLHGASRKLIEKLAQVSKAGPTAYDLDIAIQTYQLALRHYFHFKEGDVVKEYDTLVNMNVSPMEGLLAIDSFVPVFKDGIFDADRMATVNNNRRRLITWLESFEK